MKLLPFDYAARNAGRSPLRTALMVLGACGVVLLVLVMAAFVQSLGETMRATGDPNNVIVLGAGSEDYLEQSEIGPAVPAILSASVTGVATLGDKRLVSPEIHHSAVITLPDQGEEGSRNALVRGVTPQAYAVHSQVEIVEGRDHGAGQILVGRLAHSKLGLPQEALRPGKQLVFEGKTWTISGTMAAPGTAFEAEIWAPLEELKLQTKRDTISCVIVRLADISTFADVDLFCKSRLDLELAALPESDYYSGLAKFFRPMQVMGWVMAGMIVVSGLFGGLNVMLAAISSRTKELACLETLGFSRRAIVLSLMQESFIQVGAGTLLACGVAGLVLDGIALRYTMGAIALTVGPEVILAGIAAGFALAFFGTLFPALRFARTPIVEQLR